jgi:hypothetical protein
VNVIGKRDVSTVPNQALHLYNSPFVIDQSEHLAAVVTKMTEDIDARIAFVWQQTLGRNATPEELANANAFLKDTQAEVKSDNEAWTSLCQALLVTNEFRYVD